MNMFMRDRALLCKKNAALFWWMWQAIYKCLLSAYCTFLCIFALKCKHNTTYFTFLAFLRCAFNSCQLKPLRFEYACICFLLKLKLEGCFVFEDA